MQNHKTRPIVSIVIPIYNEARNVEILVNETDKEIEKLKSKYVFEIIFVNDGSQDETYDIIVNLTKSKKNIKLIDLSRNFGNQIAVTAGINESNGDIVITMDGDMQHPPSVIPELIAKWEKGYEVVQAKRIQYKSPGFLKNILSSMFFFIMNRISTVNIEKGVSDFRLMDRKVVDYFKKVPERIRFIRGIISWLGFRKTYIEYQIKPRLEGDTTFSISRLFKLAMIGLTSFSLFPLKIAFVSGFLITILSSGLLIWMGFVYLFISKTTFRPIAFFAVLNALMGGIILLCLGAISFYIGSIHEEVRNRPLYVIRERINFNEENSETIRKTKELKQS